MGAMYGVWCLLVCSLLDDFVLGGEAMLGVKRRALENLLDASWGQKLTIPAVR